MNPLQNTAQDARAGYPPKPGESSVAGEEDLSFAAPRLRRAARMDRDLTDSAKVLFDHLTDLSFLPSVSPARGVVTMSKRKLAEELHSSGRSISRRRVELEAKR